MITVLNYGTFVWDLDLYLIPKSLSRKSKMSNNVKVRMMTVLELNMNVLNQVCATTHKRPIGESEAFFLHSALLPRGTFCMQSSA